MPLSKYSNYTKAKANTIRYLGREAKLLLSTRKAKKYMIEKPSGGYAHFGAYGYEDFTKHGDEERRQNYLKRTANIAGNWKRNRFSPNSLARNILWQ